MNYVYLCGCLFCVGAHPPPALDCRTLEGWLPRPPLLLWSTAWILCLRNAVVSPFGDPFYPFPLSYWVPGLSLHITSRLALLWRESYYTSPLLRRLRNSTFGKIQILESGCDSIWFPNQQVTRTSITVRTPANGSPSLELLRPLCDPSPYMVQCLWQGRLREELTWCASVGL